MNNKLKPTHHLKILNGLLNNMTTAAQLNHLKLLILLLAICNLASIRVCLAQNQSKGIEAEEFTAKRPAARKPSFAGEGTGRKNPASAEARIARNSSRLNRKRVYRAVNTSRPLNSSVPPKSSVKNQPGLEAAALGFTLWRFRPTNKEDETKELVEVQNEGGNSDTAQYTLERLSANAPINPGELLRFSVESLSHNGYLYVIDRERYADGSFGAAKLVFPTLGTKDRNYVGAGLLAYIPASPRYFRLISNQTNNRQVAEVITLIVSPRPLIDHSLLKTTSIELNAAQFAAWEKQWRADFTEFEEVDGVGQTMTLPEQDAGREASKGLEEVSANLTQDDAPPQTVYRGMIKKGNPILVAIELNLQPK